MQQQIHPILIDYNNPYFFYWLSLFAAGLFLTKYIAEKFAFPILEWFFGGIFAGIKSAVKSFLRTIYYYISALLCYFTDYIITRYIKPAMKYILPDKQIGGIGEYGYRVKVKTADNKIVEKRVSYLDAWREYERTNNTYDFDIHEYMKDEFWNDGNKWDDIDNTADEFKPSITKKKVNIPNNGCM